MPQRNENGLKTIQARHRNNRKDRCRSWNSRRQNLDVVKKHSVSPITFASFEEAARKLIVQEDICWRKPVAGQSVENHQKVICFDGAVCFCAQENSLNFSKVEISLMKKMGCSSYTKGWMPAISDTLDKNSLPDARFRICKEWLTIPWQSWKNFRSLSNPLVARRCYSKMKKTPNIRSTYPLENIEQIIIWNMFHSLCSCSLFGEGKSMQRNGRKWWREWTKSGKGFIVITWKLFMSRFKVTTCIGKRRIPRSIGNQEARGRRWHINCIKMQRVK